MAKGPTNSEGPIALAMVICDAVLRDESTKKPTLVGLFNQITAANLPAIHDRLHVFLSLTNGRGELPCLLQCKDQDEGVVCEVGGSIRFGNPLEVADVDIEMRGVVFEKEGLYVFEFSCDGQFLTRRRFLVSKEKSDEH
jgi:hypothetical protein